MIILRATVDILQVVTSSAADIEVHVSAMEADNAAPPVVQDIVRTNTPSITTATTTTILDCTTANRRRNVKHINVFNNHGSTTCTVTVQHTDGTNVEILFKAVLLAGESLVYTQGGVWIHYDANGGMYPSVGNAAGQAEMETPTATDKYVTPLGVNWHPGVCKCWYRVTVSGGAPTLASSWNITSITDTATGQLTVTIATDFSAVNYAIVTGVERAATALTVANLRVDAVRNASVAAGSFIHECWDQAATTAAAADPATWYGACFGDQ